MSKIDKKALTKICLTLEGSAITQVRSAKTASEAWTALQNAYEDKGDSILHGSPYRGLYKLDCTVNMPRDVACDVHSDSATRYQLWHKRLGHLCRIGMNHLRNSHEEFHDASADPLPEKSCPPETELLEDCPVVEDRRYPARDSKPPDYFSYHTLAEDREPQTYSQAMRDDDADKWKSAMQDEYDSLMKMNTWKLVDRPDRKIIPCKWVYKLKTDTHAAEMDLKMHHLDVDTAFLNGDLEEEVYMDQPQGFVKKGHEDKMARCHGRQRNSLQWRCRQLKPNIWH
ncbi:uncharacterized protein [Choristoneura fumiferana]|uniref:uncharacterized protein n=1 Tax=Choristoneura fumiferana TaxID=7141 RepID=UPI003D15E824